MSLVTLILASCGTANQRTSDEQASKEILAKSDSTLLTGWYYLQDSGGLKRQLDRDTTWYFIDPIPIVTAKNFERFEIYESRFGDIGLSMQLDDEGAIVWSEATEKATDKQLGFILDDKLLHVPTVNSQVVTGMTALNRGIYSKQELERFQKRIEDEVR
jgi:preprotein translocase subunit SecD